MGECSEKKLSSSQVFEGKTCNKHHLCNCSEQLCIVWCLYLTGINHCIASFYVTCLKVEGSSWSFHWGILFSPAAELTSVFAIAYMIFYSRMKLFGLIFALQLGKTERHSWSYTSVPSTKSSWVPYIIPCWLFSESLFGQRAREH